MITVAFVVKTLGIAFALSFVVIFCYYIKLRKCSNDEVPSALKNTDIVIANGTDEIKIICK